MIARAVGEPVIGGMAPVLAADRAGVVAALEEYDLVLGVENHPERTPQEYLESVTPPLPEESGFSLPSAEVGDGQALPVWNTRTISGKRFPRRANPAVPSLGPMGDPAGGRIGAALDTGWFGTHGYDAADAIEAVADRLKHVHLKDVAAPGGHDTVALGEGCVPVRRCVEVLRRIGYEGTISIEHEPEDRDPVPEVLRSRELLRQWLAA